MGITSANFFLAAGLLGSWISQSTQLNKAPVSTPARIFASVSLYSALGSIFKASHSWFHLHSCITSKLCQSRHEYMRASLLFLLLLLRVQLWMGGLLDWWCPHVRGNNSHCIKTLFVFLHTTHQYEVSSFPKLSRCCSLHVECIHLALLWCEPTTRTPQHFDC